MFLTLKLESILKKSLMFPYKSCQLCANMSTYSDYSVSWTVLFVMESSLLSCALVLSCFLSLLLSEFNYTLLKIVPSSMSLSALCQGSHCCMLTWGQYFHLLTSPGFLQYQSMMWGIEFYLWTKGFLRLGTFSAKIRKVLGKLGQTGHSTS